VTPRDSRERASLPFEMAGNVPQIEQPRILEALLNSWLDRLEMDIIVKIARNRLLSGQ
jgi:hypothetical protein